MSAVSPALRFRGQPFDDEGAIGDVLRRLLSDPRIDELTLVVAWVRLSGLGKLRDELVSFKGRGRSRIITGIDRGGATAPGLRAAKEWFSEAYAYHETTSTIFHPKLCLAEGPATAVLVVGSNNATLGGLWMNHEAALEAQFERPQEDHDPSLVGARSYIEALLTDATVCVRLTDQLIDDLVSLPSLRIATTERISPAATPRPAGDEPETGGEEEAPPADGSENGPFGISARMRVGPPPSPTGLAADVEVFEGETVATTEPTSTPPPSVASAPAARAAGTATAIPPGARAPMPAGSPASGAATVVASWSKQLDGTGAQQPPNANTNPTGNLRLSKAGHDIDWRTWFRQNLFGPAPWAPDADSRNNPIEVVTVAMDVTVLGAPHGVENFKLTHAKHREADQDNVPTVLHWGPLSTELRANDYTGHTVTLARLSDGTYRLDIA